MFVSNSLRLHYVATEGTLIVP